MAEHNDIGRDGESVAASYIEKCGMQILQRNWRAGHLEIDIIARDGEQIVFVEVKTRKQKPTHFSDVLSKSKIKNTIEAANVYMRTKAIEAECRFDLLLLTCNAERFDIEHIPNAYRSYLR